MHVFSSVAVLADLRGLGEDDAGRCSLRGGLVDEEDETSDDKPSASAALKSFSDMLVETTESRRVSTRAAVEEHVAVATGRFILFIYVYVCISRLECNPTVQTVARMDPELSSFDKEHK